MIWCNPEKAIPQNKEFIEIVYGMIFNCPSCIRTKESKIKGEIKTKKRKTLYNPVSHRKNSFKSRNIIGNLLTTILAQIRKPLQKSNAYAVIKTSESVEKKVDDIICHSSLEDKQFELMVYQTRSDMPDTEAIYYYIRNAFAHGSFEVKGDCYYLESCINKRITAQMRLKQSTLLRYIQLANMSANEIKSLQNAKKK